MRKQISLLTLAVVMTCGARPLMAGDLLDALENPNGPAAERIRKEADSYHDPQVQARARQATSWKDKFERCMGRSLSDVQAGVAVGEDPTKGVECANQADRIVGNPSVPQRAPTLKKRSSARTSKSAHASAKSAHVSTTQENIDRCHGWKDCD